MIPMARPRFGEAEKERLVAFVEEGGRLTRGPEVEAFEREFAAFCGVDRGVAVANGTAALHTALRAVGVREGDRVAVPPFSFVATANAVRWCRAEPVFVDVNRETFCLDPDALAARLRDGERFDAVVAVHLFGLPCAMDRFAELAEEYGFALVEDAAQAHGARFDGAPVGSLGDAAAFSFFASKNMTTGEGGMVTTDRADVAERARSFVEHGRTDEGYDGLGHNFAMSDLTAVVGRAQLERLPERNARRRRTAEELTATLAASSDVEPPVGPDGRRHVYHQYTVRTNDRDGLRNHLRERGVSSAVYYDVPIHRQPAYDGVDADVPTADRLSSEVVSVPVHPELTDEEAAKVAEALGSFG